MMSQVFHTQGSPEIAVVGAGGFIGSRTTWLAEQQNVPTAAFTRANPLVLGGELNPGARGVKTIVWSASMITPSVAESSPEAVLEEREQFSEAVRVLSQQEQRPRFIVLSSGGTVYGGTSAPYSEDDAPNPVNRYGAARLGLEQVALQSSLNAIVLRVANAYGPGQKALRGQGVIGHWFNAILKGEPITVYGDGSSVRDYVYVDDIAQAILLSHASTTLNANHILNIGSGEPTTLTKLARLCLRTAEINSEIRYEEHRGFDAPANWLDVSAAADQLGWAPNITLREGLKHTWDSLQPAR